MKFPLFILAFFLPSISINLLSQSIKENPAQLSKLENPAPPSNDMKDIRSIPNATNPFSDDPLIHFNPNHISFNFERFFHPNQTSTRHFDIKRDAETGLVTWISGKIDNATSQRGLSTEERCLHYLDALKNTLQIENPADEFFIKKSTTDRIGNTHIRMRQEYQGIPIYRSQLILHEKDQEIYALNGRYFATPDLADIEAQISFQDAKNLVQADVISFTNFIPLTEKQEQLIKRTQFEGELVIAHLQENIQQPILAYRVNVKPHLMDKWEYLVDAKTGAILYKYHDACNYHHHDSADHCSAASSTEHQMSKSSMELPLVTGPTTADAVDLLGMTRTINTFEAEGTYFLTNTSKDMYVEGTVTNSTDGLGIIVTADAMNTNISTSGFDFFPIISSDNTWDNPTAVSAHYNSNVAYDYFKNTFDRESIDGQGGTVLSIINVAKDNASYDNASWHEGIMYYGNGGEFFDVPFPVALDVAGHEMSHGVIDYTADLIYQFQSGAMNESYADIFGVMMDREDWLIGEDGTNQNFCSTDVTRNMADPNNGGTSPNDNCWQPKTMDEFLVLTASQDNGGVHYNSGILNYAYYLFATSVSKEVAEQVYYHALVNYLVPTAQFSDLRKALVQSATDLYDATVIDAINTAFDEVGIDVGTAPEPPVDYAVNEGEQAVLYTSSLFEGLFINDTLGNNIVPPQLSTTQIISRPSITDNGSTIVFVDQDFNLKFIQIDWENQIATESYFQNLPNPQWRNVTIAKDGSRIAALRNFQENLIWVYDFGMGFWQSFEIKNPIIGPLGPQTFTMDAKFADAIEFNHAGTKILYDAFNQVAEPVTNSSNFWDIGLIDVFNTTTNTYDTGDILKVLPPFPPGISIGNPTFAKNNSALIALDIQINLDSVTTYALATFNLFSSTDALIKETQNLTFPNFSVDDNSIIYDSIRTDGTMRLAKIDLLADKTGPIMGSDRLLFPDGAEERAGVWFARGNRVFDEPTTSIKEIQKGQIAIFPNPFEQSITLSIENSGTERIDVQILDLWGRMVFQKQQQLLLGKNTLEYPLQNLSNGTYFIQIHTSTGSYYSKLLKQ